MKSSESLAKIAPALLKAQQAITYAEKKADNPFFKSKYADLPTVISAIKPALNDNGITFLQLPSEGPMGALTLTTRLMHESGEWIESTGTCPLLKQDPQAFGSAMTYFRRYALAGVTGLFQDDDDANVASGHVAPPQAAKTTYSAPAKAQPDPAPVHVPRDADAGKGDWRAFPVPAFMCKSERNKKYAGQCLGDMGQDVLWWANNYSPKPYNGKISAQDLALREALNSAQAAFSSPVSEGSQADQDVPF